MIKVKRVYEAPAADDGFRVLVDRVWPRGLKKKDVVIDHWLKGAAPSPALRQWFAHDPAKWAEFSSRYAEELDAKPEVVRFLEAKSRAGPLTLLYAARDTEHNNAVALRAYLERRTGAA